MMNDLEGRNLEEVEQGIPNGVAPSDSLSELDEPSREDLMIINMGPQHPSTHGVLRFQMELEGEAVRSSKPIIGYLHTGMEKTAEALTFSSGGTNVTRMDYLSPFHNELCYSLAVEKLLGVEVPERAKIIRILVTELNRVASHLVSLATSASDIGSLSMMLYGFREREAVIEFFEKTTGLRMNHNYIRPGGVAADLPSGWKTDVKRIIELIRVRLRDYEDLLENNPIWIKRTQNVGVISAEQCLANSISGPTLRASGMEWDLRKAFPYSGIERFEFNVPTGENGDAYDRHRVRTLKSSSH